MAACGARRVRDRALRPSGGVGCSPPTGLWLLTPPFTPLPPRATVHLDTLVPATGPLAAEAR